MGLLGFIFVYIYVAHFPWGGLIHSKCRPAQRSSTFILIIVSILLSIVKKTFRVNILSFQFTLHCFTNLSTLLCYNKGDFIPAVQFHISKHVIFKYHPFLVRLFTNERHVVRETIWRVNLLECNLREAMKRVDLINSFWQLSSCSCRLLVFTRISMNLIIFHSLLPEQFITL